jgi:hypothetical protein
MLMYAVLTQDKQHCLHKPIVNLSSFQKSAQYAGIKIFNNLPSVNGQRTPSSGMLLLRYQL